MVTGEFLYLGFWMMALSILEYLSFWIMAINILYLDFWRMAVNTTFIVQNSGSINTILQKL